jgi:hypothetical protein
MRTPPMAIMEIMCPRCARHGFVSADRLASIPHCADCGLARMVRSGGKVVRSHLAANIDAHDDKPRKPPGTEQRVLVPAYPSASNAG